MYHVLLSAQQDERYTSNFRCFAKQTGTESAIYSYHYCPPLIGSPLTIRALDALSYESLAWGATSPDARDHAREI